MKLNGPGKYDDIATKARVEAGADGVLLIVFGGRRGPGFSAQLPPDLLITIPVYRPANALQRVSHVEH